MTSPPPPSPVDWLPPPPPPASASRRPRPWVVAIVVVWVAVLVGAGVYAVVTGGPTDREQTTVGEALPVVDRAASDIVRAISADGQAVAAISDLTRASNCTITVFRSGVRYERVVNAFVAPGTEAALLQRVAGRLPASYQATVRNGASPRLVGDAGYYVAINAAVQGPGVIRFVIDTGSCRRPGDIPAVNPTEPSSRQEAPAADVLARIAVPAAGWHLSTTVCPSGGSVETVIAHGEKGVLPGPLPAALSAVPGRIVVSTPNLFAYTVDGVSVAARVVDGSVLVTATTPCPGQ